VPPEELDSWAALLTTADPNPGHQTELYDCVSHQLNCIEGDSLITLSQSDVSEVVLPALIDGLVTFLTATLN